MTLAGSVSLFLNMASSGGWGVLRVSHQCFLQMKMMKQMESGRGKKKKHLFKAKFSTWTVMLEYFEHLVILRTAWSKKTGSQPIMVYMFTLLFYVKQKNGIFIFPL